MMADQTTQPQEDLVELEIAAFMGPHIKRARIALVLIGLLYAWTAYRAYGGIAHAREAMKGVSSSDPDLGELKSLVDLAYFIVVFTGVSGIANIVLAAIAGTKTTFAIYTAMGIFAVHTAIQLYATKGLILTSWLWWITAIVLGMGFQAAWKAQKLRKERAQPSL
jgi:hypothetical protein